jgi:hypothetical protein
VFERLDLTSSKLKPARENTSLPSRTVLEVSLVLSRLARAEGLPRVAERALGEGVTDFRTLGDAEERRRWAWVTDFALVGEVALLARDTEALTLMSDAAGE